MKEYLKTIIYFFVVILAFSCNNSTKKESNINTVKEQSILNAKDILGNPSYLAISYGGYRHVDHDIEPTINELKDDMKLLSVMGIKILRTYKVFLPQASNILKAITELKKEDSNFEMYVMLGAWIDCKNSFNWENGGPNHDEENERNAQEIETAVALAKQYPNIVKIIAVGNEAMVKWATSYYVQPSVILKWVNHLQEMKKEGELSKDLWITSSDNFASWGGGGEEYHVDDLNKLIKAVDYISMHTYPMHDTHYQPEFWLESENQVEMTDLEKIDAAMLRAKKYAMSQHQSVKDYMKNIGVDKPIHIGETGWSSVSTGHYGSKGSKASDEYKESLYYQHMRDWTNEAELSCFFFEGFDEPWKGGNNPGNSEKHFGLINIKGQAKYALWNLVDKGIFEGLTRDGQPITKTYNGDKEVLMQDVLAPPTANETASD